MLTCAPRVLFEEGKDFRVIVFDFIPEPETVFSHDLYLRLKLTTAFIQSIYDGDMLIFRVV